MKFQFFLILVISFFASQQIQAECAEGSFSTFPSHQQTLAPNSILLLQGYGICAEVIRGLGKKHPIYLNRTTIKQQVQVEVIETNNGFAQTQALLKFGSTLQAGERYELVIGGLSETQETLFNSGTFQWKVEGEQDKEKPLFAQAPTFKQNHYEELGCGLIVASEFKTSAQDDSPILYHIELTNKDGVKSRHYVVGHKGRLDIGHGMCSGDFLLKTNHKYQMKIQAMDMSGNRSKETHRLSFKSPKAKVF